ncbi:nuclear pore complex protein Nup98-Nup96 [Pelomyxa schiedti]|nr:nuclear pore complex protein Nup98-Nup96 [Pelomyxa schiedti]
MTALFSFGASANTTTPSLFGAATPAATPSLFGTPAATPSLFGTPSTTPSATPSLFGTAATATPAATPSLFGAPPSAAAPTATGLVFGAASGTPGATTPSLFGTPGASTPSLFGTPGATAAATSTPSLFGTPGNPTATPSLFGTPGATATPTPTLFGTPTAAATMTPANPFSFGNPVTSTPSTIGIGIGTGATGYTLAGPLPPFQFKPFVDRSNNEEFSHQSITASPDVAKWSFEELRWDYTLKRGSGASVTTPTPSSSLFPTATTTLFPPSSTTPAATPAFGFGTTAATPSLFNPTPTPSTGATPTPNLFGLPASTTPATPNLFSMTPSTPATSTPTPNLFGIPATTPGATTTTPSLFNISTPTTTPTTPSLFGPPAAAPTSTTPSLFAPSSSTPSLFGMPPSTPSLFPSTPTSTPATSTPATSIFSPIPAASTSLFPSTPSNPTTSLFAPTPATPSSSLFPPATNSLFSPTPNSLFSSTTLPKPNNPPSIFTPAATPATSNLFPSFGGQSSIPGSPATPTTIAPSTSVSSYGNVPSFSDLKGKHSNPLPTLPSPLSPNSPQDQHTISRGISISTSLLVNPRARSPVLPAALNSTNSRVSIDKGSPNRKVQASVRLEGMVDNMSTLRDKSDSPASSYSSSVIRPRQVNALLSESPGGETNRKQFHRSVPLSSPGLPASNAVNLSLSNASSEDEDPEQNESMEYNHHQPTTTPQRSPNPSPSSGSSYSSPSSASPSSSSTTSSASTASPSFIIPKCVDNFPRGPTNPKLTFHDPQYYTYPPLRALQAMTPEQLGSVVDLTIGCEDVGEVFFPGPTDLRGVDLRESVEFTPRHITLFPNNVKKPPVGTGLNRPARLTLHNCKPRNASQQGKYAEKLKQVTAQFGGRLVSYDPDTGKWVFEVDNFSVQPGSIPQTPPSKETTNNTQRRL